MSVSKEADRRQTWAKAPLADIGILLSGQSPPTATVNRDSVGTVYVSGPEQWDGHRVHADKWTTEPKRTAPGGSIFITVKGAAVGKIFPGIEAAIGRDIYAFVPHERMSPRYVEHALRYSVQDVLRHAVGDISGLSRRHILEHEIPVPPLSVQEEIVAELEKQFSRLDEAVGNLKRAKANLKRYKGSLLQSVTGGQFDIERASCALGSESNSWRWLTIEKLASSEPRSIQSGPFGSNLLHSEFQSSGNLVIGIDNVQDGEFSIGSNHRISESKFAALEKYRARPKDVLITVMATVGRVCVVPADIEPAIITKHVYRITVDRSVAVPEYVGIALRGARDVRAQLLESVQGQTRPGLNGTLIKRIRVPIPPLAEQHRIVAEVDRHLSIIREVEAEVDANLKRAERTRQSLLAVAFNPRGHNEGPQRTSGPQRAIG